MATFPIVWALMDFFELSSMNSFLSASMLPGMVRGSPLLESVKISNFALVSMSNSTHFRDTQKPSWASTNFEYARLSCPSIVSW